MWDSLNTSCAKVDISSETIKRIIGFQLKFFTEKMDLGLNNMRIIKRFQHFQPSKAFYLAHNRLKPRLFTLKRFISSQKPPISKVRQKYLILFSFFSHQLSNSTHNLLQSIFTVCCSYFGVFWGHWDNREEKDIREEWETKI